jgi:hypothetical protein
VTSGSPTTITFNNIPQTFTDLMIVFQGRDTNSGASSYGLFLKINGDATSGNYTMSQWIYGSDSTGTGTSAVATTDGSQVGYVSGLSGLATAVTQLSLTLANYASAVFHKTYEGAETIHYSGGTSKIYKLQSGGSWKSTAAITDLVLKTAGSGFADGTTATLYGLG